jgi:hypothetical protein
MQELNQFNSKDLPGRSKNVNLNSGIVTKKAYMATVS